MAVETHNMRLQQENLRQKMQLDLRKEIDAQGKQIYDNMVSQFDKARETGDTETGQRLKEAYGHFWTSNAPLTLSSSAFNAWSFLQNSDKYVSQKSPENVGAQKGKAEVAENEAKGLPGSGKIEVREAVEGNRKYAISFDPISGKVLSRRDMGEADNPGLVLTDIPNPDGTYQHVLYDKKKMTVVDKLGTGFKTQATTIPGQVEAEALRRHEIGVRNLYDRVSEVKAAVQQGGAQGLALPGAISRFTSDIVANMKGIADLAGVDLSKFEDNTMGGQMMAKAADVWARIKTSAPVSDEVKSALTELAYTTAALDNTSRNGVGVQSFKNHLLALGSSIDDPARFTAQLDRIATRAQKNFENHWDTVARDSPMMKDKPRPDIAGEKRAAEQGRSPTGVVIPEGAKKFRHPITGEVGFSLDGGNTVYSVNTGKLMKLE